MTELKSWRIMLLKRLEEMSHEVSIVHGHLEEDLCTINDLTDLKEKLLEAKSALNEYLKELKARSIFQ